MGRARCARSDPVDVRRRIGAGRGGTVARPEPATGPACRRAARGDDASTRRWRWRSATTRRWRASASPPCPPTTGRAASAPTARRRCRRPRRWRRPSTAPWPVPTARRSAPRRAARPSTGGWGRRWTSRARRWRGASPRTSARTRSSRARRWRQEVAGAKSRHVIATLKHYVANNAEWGRIGFNTPAGRAGNVNAIVSERALQEIYEAPFKRAIRESDRRRGHVLLQPAQRAADVRERGAALRPEGLGLRRLRGPRLHLRRQGPARGDARRPRRPRARRSGRAHGRDVHLRPGAGRAPGRHRPAHALRDVRLGRLRRPARAGGRQRQHARAPGAGHEGLGGRHGAAAQRPPRAAPRRRAGCARSRSSAPRATTRSTSAAARQP